MTQEQNSTPSDTFIEDWEKEFDEYLIKNKLSIIKTFSDGEATPLWCKDIKKLPSDLIKQFLKSSLQEQRQEIEREIDKLSFENGEDWGEGKSEKLVWLEDIKVLLK